MRYANILETIGNTPLVELKHLNPRPDVHIFAKLEGVNPSGSLKDRIAKKMIEQAEGQRMLTPDSILLEPTSGNTGVALALVANMKGYPFTAVISEKGTQDKRRRQYHYFPRVGRQQWSYQAGTRIDRTGQAVRDALPIWQRGEFCRTL
jgi:cysteine synthase